MHEEEEEEEEETDDVGGARGEPFSKNNRGEIASDCLLPHLNYFEGNSRIESSRFRGSGEAAGEEE